MSTIVIQYLGNVAGPKYLDSRTKNGIVGLASSDGLSGTKSVDPPPLPNLPPPPPGTPDPPGIPRTIPLPPDPDPDPDLPEPGRRKIPGQPPPD